MSTVNFNLDKRRRYPGLSLTVTGEFIEPLEGGKSECFLKVVKDQIQIDPRKVKGCYRILDFSKVKEPHRFFCKLDLSKLKDPHSFFCELEEPETYFGEGISRIPLAFKLPEKESREGSHLPYKMTPEQNAAHAIKCMESEGFDVPDVPSHICAQVIRPVPEQNDPAALQEAYGAMSMLALRVYNNRKRTVYQFVQVIRVNAIFTGAIWYYITFQAKKDGSNPKNFQARVCQSGGVENKVEFCRVEPEPELP